MLMRDGMLTRTAKATFYKCAGPLMKANGFLYRHLRSPRSGTIKVHLGPGKGKYINGWVNIDANIFYGKCDVWADLNNSLPFNKSTVDAFYSHHVVEHLPNMKLHFQDVFRCLKHGGVYRVGGPNGDSAIAKFVENDLEWFIDFPDSYRSIGGRFENFIFCRQEHLTILTFSFIAELMQEAGFTDLRLCLPVRETHFPEKFQECMATENEWDFNVPHTLIIEGVKP
jgi:predicted SAM-dependent methyltransferase